MLKHKILFLAVTGMLVLAAVAGPSLASAQTDSYTPLAPLPCISGGGFTCPSAVGTTVNFQSYVQYAYNLLIALAAVAAVFMITFGGFEYMTSDAVGKKSEGIKKITNAIYGLILVLSSYLILRTINPQFVEVNPGLVTPLGLTPANNLRAWENALQNELQSEMSAFNSNQADLRQQIAVAGQQVGALQDQLSALKQQELYDCAQTFADSGTACSNDKFQEVLLQNQISGIQSSTALVTAKGIIDGYIAQCGTTGNLSTQVTTASNGDCYANNHTAINSVLSNQALTSQLQPDQLQSLRIYAAASNTILSMDSYVSSYNQQLAAYNLTEFGTGGTISTIATTIARNTGGIAGGENAINYANIQLAQTQALAGIDKYLKAAQSSVDTQTYQQLSTQAQTLKNQIVAPKKP